jgi:hypothetical protein
VAITEVTGWKTDDGIFHFSKALAELHELRLVDKEINDCILMGVTGYDSDLDITAIDLENLYKLLTRKLALQVQP